MLYENYHNEDYYKKYVTVRTTDNKAYSGKMDWTDGKNIRLRLLQSNPLLNDCVLKIPFEKVKEIEIKH